MVKGIRHTARVLLPKLLARLCRNRPESNGVNEGMEIEPVE